MAAAWPLTIPAPARFSINPMNVVVGTANPFSGAREIMPRYHRWHVYMEWNAVSLATQQAVMTHFTTYASGATPFSVPLFNYRAKIGTKSGTTTFNGNHAAGDTTIDLTGGTGLLAAGDWVQIAHGGAADPYAYLVVSPEASGNFVIMPALRDDKLNGDSIGKIGTGTANLIHDTMEFPEGFEPDFGALEVATPVPLWGNSFALEFVTALRRW
jgi:hypothetical protein